MPSITIRNLSEDTVTRLKARAQANRRSLEGEVRTLLDAAARHPAGRQALIGDMETLARSIESRNAERALPDSATTLADLRDARLGQLDKRD